MGYRWVAEGYSEESYLRMAGLYVMGWTAGDGCEIPLWGYVGCLHLFEEFFQVKKNCGKYL